MPILLAVSPLRAMRSAPTITAIDAARAHRERGGRVDHEHGFDAGVAQLEVVQARALQQRPRFVDEHVRLFPGAMRGDDDAERRAAAGGRDRPGIAVGEDAGALAESAPRRVRAMASSMASARRESLALRRAYRRMRERGRPPTPN